MKKIYAFLLLTCFTIPLLAQNKFITVSSAGRNNEAGLFVFRWTSDRLELIEKSDLVKSTSYHTIHPHRPFLYAVGNNKVYAFSLSQDTGHLTLLNEVESGGNGPCYISIDHTGNWAFVANYSGATVAVFPVHKDGTVGMATTIWQHEGSSVDTARQKASHPHLITVSPANDFVVVPDLGQDKVLIYQFDTVNGSLMNHGFGKSFPGSGPRHLEFHPNLPFVYVLNELSSSVSAFQWDNKEGLMEMVATYPLLPGEFHERNTSADIHITRDGKFLFASNRGHDSICSFSINSDGTLHFENRFPSGGKTPRNFFIIPDDRFILVANQVTGNIVQYALDKNAPSTTKANEYDNIPGAQCIKMWNP